MMTFGRHIGMLIITPAGLLLSSCDKPAQDAWQPCIEVELSATPSSGTVPMSHYGAAGNDAEGSQANSEPSVDQCYERSRKNNRPARSDEHPAETGAVRGIAVA